ncbi:hypothetical protein CL658_05885 [bacterium]|nr:hypothetical protein [bacterium]|tara:strand:+ start:1654 stop:2058 length:405 start_codon:yes stop_codon:yes gene_type:complete
MMSIKTKYALAVLVKMALDEPQSYTIKQLSEACGVPKKYLEQILSVLRKENIVSSTRGANGGYTLARPASLITVLEIASCLEQSLSFARGYNGAEAITEFWESIDEQFKTSLAITIDELVYNQLKTKQVLLYSI